MMVGPWGMRHHHGTVMARVGEWCYISCLVKNGLVVELFVLVLHMGKLQISVILTNYLHINAHQNLLYTLVPFGSKYPI